MKKRLKIIVISIVSLLIVLIGGFFAYTSDYYRADDVAIKAIASDTGFDNQGDMIILSPSVPSDTALIFYPGGKVEYTAYIPILEKLKQNGITCVLVKMPFNLAVFNINAADNVYKKLPNIKNWYIGGHSLGGAMASSYMGKNSNKVKGLILLGAYPINNIDIPTFVIYGSEDKGLDKTKLDGVSNKLEIKGGNHAYFGNYGEQRGDGTAVIARDDQQAQAVEAILKFIK